jgi:hypothetical protein
MNLPVYLAGLVLATLLASACLVAILIYFPPSSADLLIFTLFYLSLFISATGVFCIFGLLIRRISRKGRTPLSINQAMRQFGISFRQGMFLAIILLAALILQSQGILIWWYLLILIILIGLAEWWLMRK